MTTATRVSDSRSATAAGRDGRGALERHGLLIVDKPRGVTSHDVVDRVRRALKVRGAGHLGTLDPAATGLLVVAVGAATRCVPVWQGGDKVYEGVARFGVTTDTQDTTGRVLETVEVAEIDAANVRRASRDFVGEIDQIPPMVSALKVGGEPLHRLARRGITVERVPRRIRVHDWEWMRFDAAEAAFRMRCSAGTYVRTLVHDLGARLGTGAALASLRRLVSEPFGLGRAVTWNDLMTVDPEGLWERGGLALETALATLSSVMVDARGAESVGRGAPAELGPAPSRGAEPPIDGGPRSVVVSTTDGRALALGEIRRDAADPSRLKVHPQVVFPWAVRLGSS